MKNWRRRSVALRRGVFLRTGGDGGDFSKINGNNENVSQLQLLQILDDNEIKLKVMEKHEFISKMKSIPNTKLKKSILNYYNSLKPDTTPVTENDVICTSNCDLFFNQASKTVPVQVMSSIVSAIGDTSKNAAQTVGTSSSYAVQTVADTLGALFWKPSSSAGVYKGGKSRKRRKSRRRQIARA
jgi:hypothetical protein